MLFRSGLHKEASGNSSNSKCPATYFYLSTSTLCWGTSKHVIRLYMRWSYPCLSSKFRSRRWGSSLPCLLKRHSRSAPHRHERKFSIARVCRITFKHLPQLLTTHIKRKNSKPNKSPQQAHAVRSDQLFVFIHIYMR